MKFALDIIEAPIAGYVHLDCVQAITMGDSAKPESATSSAYTTHNTAVPPDLGLLGSYP
jgi:hypothetical protein